MRVSSDLLHRAIVRSIPLWSLVTVILFATHLSAAQDRYGDALPAGAIQRLGTLRMRYPSDIGDLCYLPDGRGVIAVANTIEIWDLAKGAMVGRHTVCKAELVSVLPRSDAKVLLLADSAGSVHEWDLADHRVLRQWPTGQNRLRRAHYSPDGQRVLTTGSKPPTIKQWDLETSEELVAITGGMHYFHEAIYGPDGKTAFVCGGAGSGPVLAHYDLATGRLIHQWHKDYYTHSRSIELSADRQRLILGSRHMGTEWQLTEYKLLRKFKGHHGHAVTSIAYCKEPDQLLTGSRDGSIRRWDRDKGKVSLRWWPHSRHVTRIAVSPDGKWVLSYGKGLVAECSMATGESRVKWERHSQAVNAVAFLPDGQHVVSGSSDGTLRVWDVHTGAAVRVIEGARLGAYAVAVRADGAVVAAGCKDGVVRELGIGDGKLIRQLKGHRGYVRALAYTPDGSRLLSSADDGSICVWVADSAKPSMRLEGHTGGVLSVAVSGDGQQALSGGRDGTVRLWDLAEAKLLKTMGGHLGWVKAVAFAGNGKQALSVARDHLLLRWDLAKGEVAGRLKHEGSHYALASSPDGTRAYSAGDDRTVTSWDLDANKPVGERAGHQKTITALAVSPDGQYVVSASDDTSLLVWEMEPR